MKKLVSMMSVFFLGIHCFSQSPQGINYQAVIRNSSGVTLSNTSVFIRMNILQGTNNGTVAYSEKHSVSTNATGAVNVVIGQGTALSGTFSNINWANGPYFIETAYDVNNSGTYTVLGTQQLMSVPYAFYAENSGTSGPAGSDGVSFTNSYIENDSLYVSLSNGQTLNTGYVKGAQGLQGLPGVSGPTGPQGIQGTSGINGTNNCYSCPTMISAISGSPMYYIESTGYCSNLNEAGYNDWRLPTLSEFEYIRDVLNIPVPSENCWTKDMFNYNVSGFNTILYVMSTIRPINIHATAGTSNTWKTVCIR